MKRFLFAALIATSAFAQPQPPMPAESAAMVVRSMFTHGSRLVIIRHAVSAEMKAGFGVSPQACSTRAQRSRSARSFATVRNWSASAARRNSMALRAASSATPAHSSARRYATATASV